MQFNVLLLPQSFHHSLQVEQSLLNNSQSLFRKSLSPPASLLSVASGGVGHGEQIGPWSLAHPDVTWLLAGVS